jgi:hypothetical protein
MRQTKLSTRLRTSDILRIFRRPRSIALWLLGVALFTVNVYGQKALPTSSRELLTTDPRALARWLETNRHPTDRRNHNALHIEAGILQ